MYSKEASIVLDLVESGIIVLDSNGVITYWNQFVSRCSNIALASALGRHWLDIFPIMEKSRVEKAVFRAINNGYPSILSHKLVKQSFPLYRKSLATRPPYHIEQSYLIKPFIDENKNRGCIIYIEDVSASAKKEKDLKVQSNELKNVLSKYTAVKNELEKVFDNTSNGIIIFDDHGVIRKANNACSNLFDIDCHDMSNMNIMELLPEIENMYLSEDTHSFCVRADIENTFEQALSGENNKHFLVSYSQIPGENGEDNFFVFINDISDIKKAENRLIEANAELEEFSYRTSHDLRSPLVSSIALLDIAKKAVEQGNSARALKCLETSTVALKQLEQLTVDLIQVTLCEHKEEAQDGVDIRELVDMAFHNVSQLNGFSEVEKRIAVDCDIVMISKPTRLQSVIENLISNAIKYYDAEESAPFVAVSAYVNYKNLVIDIADNGIGIPKDQRKKLFQMFARFHPKKSFGSGLGLYLVHKSVKSMGGTIECIDIDKGTAFKVVIPI